MRLNNLNLTPTMRCNLKCALCGVLVPQYDYRPQMTAEEFSKTLSAVFSIVDRVGRLPVTRGGLSAEESYPTPHLGWNGRTSAFAHCEHTRSRPGIHGNRLRISSHFPYLYGDAEQNLHYPPNRRSIRGAELGKIPLRKEDYLDIFDPATTLEEKRKGLEALMQVHMIMPKRGKVLEIFHRWGLAMSVCALDRNIVFPRCQSSINGGPVHFAKIRIMITLLYRTLQVCRKDQRILDLIHGEAPPTGP